MKRVVFLSRSKLALNLMELVMPSVPKKIQFRGFGNLEEIKKTYFPKPIQLVIVDDNILDGAAGTELHDILSNSLALKGARKIAVTSKSPRVDKAALAALGLTHSYIKPFLPEELAGIIDKNLGGKK